MQHQLHQSHQPPNGEDLSHSLLLEAATYIEDGNSFAPEWSESLVSRLRAEAETKAEAARRRAQVLAQETTREPRKKAVPDAVTLADEDLQVVLAALTLLQETRQQERNQLELPPLPIQKAEDVQAADTRDGQLLRAGRLHLILTAEALRRETSRHNDERAATPAQEVTATEE